MYQCHIINNGDNDDEHDNDNNHNNDGMLLCTRYRTLL